MTQDTNQEARNWAMLCHLSSLLWIAIALLSLVVVSAPLSLPFLNIVIPLILWTSKKDQHPFIDAHGKESVNFQLSLTIYGMIAVILFLLLSAVTCGIGFISPTTSQNSSAWLQIWVILGIGFGILCAIVAIVQLCLVIFAAIKAKKGEFYNYPFTIRFLR